MNLQLRRKFRQFNGKLFQEDVTKSTNTDGEQGTGNGK